MPGAKSRPTPFGFQSPPASGNSGPRSTISEVYGEGNEEEGEEGFWAFPRAKLEKPVRFITFEAEKRGKSDSRGWMGAGYLIICRPLRWYPQRRSV